ncbi:hypothetical protein PRIPAC_83301, partial [Pristionchus pacificus]
CPMEAVTPPDPVPRLLVIDACNIARSSCGPKRESVNCAGLLNVIRWLTVRDFEVNAFLPIIYKNKHNANVAHVFILNRLHELGIVSFTPARTARCERPALVNYDDLYVAQMAERHGGCILSGDRFNDILVNEKYKELHPVLRDRLNLRFIPTPYEMVEVGCDRFYKKEPTFIVDRGGQDDVVQRLYAAKHSPCYKKCLHRRRAFTEQARAKLLHALDELLDELAEREAIRIVQLKSEEPFRPSHRPGPPPHPAPLRPAPIEQTTVAEETTTTVEDTVDEEVDQLTTADEEEEMGEEADAELVPVERPSPSSLSLSLDLSFLDAVLSPVSSSSSAGEESSAAASSSLHSWLGRSTSPPPPPQPQPVMRRAEERKRNEETSPPPPPPQPQPVMRRAAESRRDEETPPLYQLPPLHELDLETMAEFLDTATLLELWLSPRRPRR